MKRDTRPGAPIWIELFTTETDSATTFYGDLFGWTAVDSGPDYGGYIRFDHDGEPVAGCMLDDGSSGAPSGWSVYLESDDAADTVAMAEANGGTVALAPMQVGDLGHMAFVVDPSGARVGVWQPLSHTGFAQIGEVGTPGWFELLSHDFEAVLPFYANVFGWDIHTMSDTPEFRYSTLGQDDNARAGIMDAAGFLGDAPSTWSTYFVVADADATVDRAVALGAAILRPAEDTPYGRMAELIDPTGVSFKISGATQDG